MMDIATQQANLAWTFGRIKPMGCQCGSRICHLVYERVMADMYRRQALGGDAAVTAPFAAFAASQAQGAAPSSTSPSAAAGAANAARATAHTATTPAPTTPQTQGTAANAASSDAPALLFTNAQVFDGSGKPPRTDVNVLVRGNLVEALVAKGETVEGARVVDCGGKLLMPGMIDAHWHSMLAGINEMSALTSDVGYLYLSAAKEANSTLMRGFTSVRDAGGPSFALKRAIDEGLINGPRIFPSGAMISQTGGHGDSRFRSDIPRSSQNPLSLGEHLNVSMIADGVPEVLRRAREQLMLGASQIKMLAGGGVASLYDPLDSTQYSLEELKAGVSAATNWNTYVMTHVYTSRGIEQAIRAGVKSIEHGQLTDEATVRMMRDEGVWWSLQPFLHDEDSNHYPDAERQNNQKIVAQGTVNAYELAQKYGIKTGWGTDVLFNAQTAARQTRQLAKMVRFYDPLTVLAQGTGTNGELLAMAGPRSPYPHTLGRIAPGAYADLLVVTGDPSVNLDFLVDEDNLNIIMKDGKFYKNTLATAQP